MERYRFHSEGAVYFVTFSVVEWLPVFSSEESCKIVTDSLNFCYHHKGLRINAYVIMPTQLHAILFHESFRTEPLVKVVTDFRKFTGRQLIDLCDNKMPSCFAETLKSLAGVDRERRFWQPSRHPVTVATEAFWRTKFDYLHLNPCRKGLVHRAVDWRFSSASHWIESDWSATIANDVVLSALHW